jgi:ubiquinone/menaquinone biosynthesis C-methylase UbiE
MDKQATTRAAEQWWNTNPFTYKDDRGVGEQLAETELTLDYFERVEQRFRKHSGGSLQADGQPLFSKFIDYEWLRGKRVLDIAVGTGFSVVNYARAGAHVTGIDITEYAIHETKRNLELRGLTGDIRKMDAQTLDFPDASFDFVSAHGCLMHMPDTERVVREIYRVLKPGGRIYVWMYHRGWYFWFNLMFLRGIVLGELFRNGFDVLAMTSKYTDGLPTGGNPHTKMYSRAGFRDLFTQAGFRDPVLTCNYNPNEWTAWPVRRLGWGRFVPRAVQQFLSERAGFAFSVTISAEKKSLV